MSGLAEAVVTFAASLLPARARERYREEWLADLQGADEAGVSRTGVALGALATAVTIDRVAPEVTGHTLGRLFGHRLRLTGAFLGGAAVLMAGYTAYGGYSDPARSGATLPTLVGVVVLVAAVVLGLAGASSLVGALHVAVAARRPVAAVVLLVASLGLGILFVAAPDLLLGFGVLAGPIAALSLGVLIVVTARGRTVGSAPARLGIAAGFAAVALAACAIGILHIAVWNPLARVPGLTLDEIYAGLAAANEGVALRGWLIAWAVVTALGAVVYAVVALAWRAASTRRIVAVGFLLVAATTAVGFIPSFVMGMSLADTFMTVGGDAAATGPALAILGQASLVAAILVAFVREPAPLPPPLASRLARP